MMTISSLLIIIISLSAVHMSVQNIISDIVCPAIKCGEGKCVSSNSSVLGFDCECNPGWKEIEIGPFTYPACVVPNCTLDFQCGNGAPPPPPPPPPPINISSPCNMVWCGDGDCVVNGTLHYCNCKSGSYNLLDRSDLACFKQCYLEGDCNGLGFGPKAPPPPTSGSPKLGSKRPNEAPSCLRNFHLLIMLVLSATLLAWL